MTLPEALLILSDPLIAAKVAAFGRKRNSKGKIVDAGAALQVVIASVSAIRVGQYDFSTPEHSDHA